ncbi:unnamed protein product [Lathyrus oleraceus]
MSITLDDVSCLLYLPIRVRLLNHERITKGKAHQMMIDYLGDDPGEEMDELDRTRGVHARFEYIKKIYETEILRAENVADDDE